MKIVGFFLVAIIFLHKNFHLSFVQLQIPDFCHQREPLQDYVAVAFGLSLKFTNYEGTRSPSGFL